MLNEFRVPETRDFVAGELEEIMCFHGRGKVVMGMIFQNFSIDLDLEVILFCACGCGGGRMFPFPSCFTLLFFVSFSFNMSSYVL